MSFSLDKYRQISSSAFLKKVVKRTLLIFLLGYLMYWFPFFGLDANHHIVAAPISHTRIMGVLQRIALCYFFASLLIHYLSARAVMLVSGSLLLGYWLLMAGFGDPAQPYSLLGNAALSFDKFLMGTNHLYHGEGIPFDPEGWLSTLPAIVNVVAGYFAGKYIQQNGKGYETIAKLMLTGALAILVALCWNMAFPINKKLWTAAFVLLTSGIDLLLISALLYIIEIKRHNDNWWTKFFVVFGKNPLFIYLLSELLVTVLYMIPVGKQPFYGWINRVLFQVIAPGSLGSLLFALTYMLFCWSIGWWLNRKRIYIRV
jgi:predicted acyltransferase